MLTTVRDFIARNSPLYAAIVVARLIVAVDRVRDLPADVKKRKA